MPPMTPSDLSRPDRGTALVVGGGDVGVPVPAGAAGQLHRGRDTDAEQVTEQRAAAHRQAINAALRAGRVGMPCRLRCLAMVAELSGRSQRTQEKAGSTTAQVCGGELDDFSPVGSIKQHHRSRRAAIVG